MKPLPKQGIRGYLFILALATLVGAIYFAINTGEIWSYLVIISMLLTSVSLFLQMLKDKE